MKIPTVGKCCCCVDLITAGKVLGWIAIVVNLFHLNSIENIQMFVHLLLSFAVSGTWLYGLENTKPNLLLVNLIVSALGLVSLFGLDIYLIYKYAVASSDRTSEDAQFLLILCICATLLGTYFWIFMYSVYEAVKKLSEQLTQSTRRDDFADTTKFVV